MAFDSRSRRVRQRYVVGGQLEVRRWADVADRLVRRRPQHTVLDRRESRSSDRQIYPRRRRNLFTDSVVALDPDKGERKWHFQFTPNDGHDWDSTEDVLLVDRMWRGENRKLLLHADRNGTFYVLDRRNGTFLSGTPFV